jgi:hypothetical protein
MGRLVGLIIVKWTLGRHWLDDMVKNLGYPKTPNLKYYWLLPGKEIDDGM